MEAANLKPLPIRQAVDHFKETVLRFSGHSFRSIREGLPGRWENYKLPLRDRAVAILGAESWKPNDIGSGRILDAVIAAIEIPGENGNNLVRWHGQYGPDSRPHKGMLAARKNASSLRKAEQLFFDLYRDETDATTCFDGLCEQFGRAYALHGYLMFLKDADRFMPIAPITFDRAFAILGIGLKTSQNCSWENYKAYNEAIELVRTSLSSEPGFADCRLVDAHSFLWLLIRIEEESIRKFGSDPKAGVKHYGPRDRSVYEMVMNAVKAADQSGKTHVQTYKNKEVREQELREHVDDLISQQKGRCNITGLPLQYLGECEDKEMLASLDRIDSNGHYERGNLQVVCRFVNRWKSNSPDSEFRRLIAIIRRHDALAEAEA